MSYAGLGPAWALRSATLEAARLMRLYDELGTFAIVVEDAMQVTEQVRSRGEDRWPPIRGDLERGEEVNVRKEARNESKVPLLESPVEMVQQRDDLALRLGVPQCGGDEWLGRSSLASNPEPRTDGPEAGDDFPSAVSHDFFSTNDTSNSEGFEEINQFRSVLVAEVQRLDQRVH